MSIVEFVDRYSATGTPYPCPWTVCKGRCSGMGVYPSRVLGDGVDPKDFDEDSGYWFVTCDECRGTGTRATGRGARYLHLLYTYWYQLWWPFWTIRHSRPKDILYFFRFIHREQAFQRRLIRQRGVV